MQMVASDRQVVGQSWEASRRVGRYPTEWRSFSEKHPERRDLTRFTRLTSQPPDPIPAIVEAMGGGVIERTDWRRGRVWILAAPTHPAMIVGQDGVSRLAARAAQEAR